MAANFWTSTHYKQLLDPEEVDVVQQLDRDRGITLEDFKLVKMHMSSYITKLAQHVKVRQRVVATAIRYMRRVYISKSLTEYDPRLVAPTCLYLAAKAEESTVQARLLVFYIKKLYPDDVRFRFEIKDILEMEMKVLEALNYYLVVFHPYRSLTQFLQDAGMMDLMQFTWGIINDTYKMDLILIHPPHLIALACIYIAVVSKDKDSVAWFEELRVDMNVIMVQNRGCGRIRGDACSVVVSANDAFISLVVMITIEMIPAYKGDFAKSSGKYNSADTLTMWRYREKSRENIRLFENITSSQDRG